MVNIRELLEKRNKYFVSTREDLIKPKEALIDKLVEYKNYLFVKQL